MYTKELGKQVNSETARYITNMQPLKCRITKSINCKQAAKFGLKSASSKQGKYI